MLSYLQIQRNTIKINVSPRKVELEKIRAFLSFGFNALHAIAESFHSGINKQILKRPTRCILCFIIHR